MLKKLLAAVSAIALTLGMVAVTAGPAAATTEETCHTFDRQPFYSGAMSQTKGTVTVTLSTQYQAGRDWNLSSSGDPLGTITIRSNGGTQDRTGQTLLNGDYNSDIEWATICTKPAPPPPPVDPTPYVLVAWAMPTAPVNLTTPTWPQAFFTKLDLATKDLHALDGQLTACGTQYQVDLYNDSPTTTALIAGGVLNGPNNPPEDFPSPSGWGVTYKLIKNADCQTTPNPATFTAAQCVAGSPGQASYTIPVTTGVSYTVQLNGTGGFAPAAADTYFVAVGTKVEVKAVAGPGHTLTGETEWSTTFATPDCKVTPATPTFTSAVCSTSEPGKAGKASYTIPVTEGVKYQVRVNNGSWTDKADGTYEVGAGAKVEVRAIALPGYTLKGVQKWSKDFKVPDCTTDVTPTKPTKTQAVCTGEEQVGWASFEIPAIEGVKYQRLVGFTWVDVAAGSHTVADGSLVTLRAVALPGFELTHTDWKSDKKTYLLLFDNLKAWKDCIVPDEPSSDPQVCVEGRYSQATFTIPSDFGVTYQIWNGATWVKIDAGTYPVTTFPADVSIRAVPKPGHHFLPGATTQWDFEFVAAEPCGQLPEHPEVTPEVTFVQTTCSVSGSYTLTVPPGLEDGVIWTVSGGLPNTLGKHAVTTPGTVTITAVPAEGYTFAGEFPEGIPMLEWSFEFAALPDDCLPTLALTGDTGVPAGALGLGTLLTLGGVLLVMARRREEELTAE